MNLQQLIEQYITFRKSLGEHQDSNGRTLRVFGRAIGAKADIAWTSNSMPASLTVRPSPATT